VYLLIDALNVGQRPKAPTKNFPGGKTPKYQWWLGDREYISGIFFRRNRFILNTFRKNCQIKRAIKLYAK